MIKMCSRCKKRPAVVYVSRVEDGKTINDGYCIQCAKELNIGPINDMLKNMNISDEEIENMNNGITEMMKEFVNPETGEFDASAIEEQFGNMFGGMSPMSIVNGMTPSPDSEGLEEVLAEPVEDDDTDKKQKKNKKKRKFKFLDSYCTNLTERARKGKTDRIIGRENELYRVIQILSRRQKNNPCLIGEPGVGKTAIAEGLAQRIANGDVPAKLINKEIYMLDLTALVAGTQFRGQFEARVKGLIEEVKRAGNIILFIDEVHTLVGTGDSEGTMSAANILKPALSRGEIQVVGATTFNEYRKYIEKDAALERRFQPVTVEEPSIEETFQMLKGVKEYYEVHHNVTISDLMLHQAVVLSERYITDRFMPDKAIDLVDEACACANLRNKIANDYLINQYKIGDLNAQLMEAETEENADFERIANLKTQIAKLENDTADVTEEQLHTDVEFNDLAHVIELWTGIPAAKIQESDLKKLSSLEDALHQKIIGQDEAIKVIAAAVKRSRVQLNKKRRPASFIFVGPTGVGKTEIVKVLANELFDTPETLIRLDMSEFMEKHAVSRIIGAPPGYIGYDEAGQLTEKVRRKPYSVILFDEIEKAHPDVLNILLQILDDGRVTDAHGRTVNFENTIIVMTSNAGSNKSETALGFGKTAEALKDEKAIKALEQILRPEFLGRVDEIVVFSALDVDALTKISELMLNEIKEPLTDRGIEFSFDENAKSALAQMSVNKPRGARELRNAIRRNVEDKITDMLVENFDNPPTKIAVSAKDGEIIINTK
ncbi:MAG: ATP-dependent Clp protease ATP-binding subunit [Acutalibacteraceae bacterium]|nr:ATP-dependent Clp protease ATP-binding subunit [Acutalibacteraceae bacterium]